MAGLLYRLSLNDLQILFIAVVKVQPNLATTYATVSLSPTRSVSSTTLWGRTDRVGARTHRTPFGVWSSCGIFPALLHSQDGFMNRTARFKSAERRGLITILARLMELIDTSLAASMRSVTKLERATSACRDQRGIVVAARGLLVEPCALGNIVTG